MKKILMTLSIALFTATLGKAQCVQTCSIYAVSPVTFSMEGMGGTDLYLNDDELSSPVPIGFNFNFMCSTYSEVVVSSNGFMTFDIGAYDTGCCSGQSIPSPGSTPNNMVAFSWNDFYPPGGGSITYTTVGVSPNQVFILTYSNIPHCCGNPSPSNTGQIKLFEFDNSIEIHSADISNDGSTSTQGIEDATGSIAVAAPGANGSLYTATNTAYRWTSNIPTPPAAVSGPTTVCTGIANVFSVAPMPGATSYTWSLPGGWVGTSITNTISAAAGAAGNVSVAATYTCGTSDYSGIGVGIISSPTVAINGNTASICPGSPITLTGTGASTYSWSTGANTSTIAPTPTANASYSVVGTSSITGCTANAVTNVTVYPSPNVTTAGSTTVCIGQTVGIASNGANTYTWQPGNLTGFLVNVSPTVTTVYTVTGKSTDGCTNTAVVTVTVMACTVGLDKTTSELKNVSIHPNPNSGNFVVELRNGLKKNVEVYDMMGRSIFVNTSEEDKMEINITAFANGIYYVKIQSADGIKVVKMVKQ